MQSLYGLTIHELNELLKNREIKSADITNSYLERIEKIDPVINSYLFLDPERAMDNAKKADLIIEKTPNGDFSELTGIPLSIKDIYLMKDTKTTCASKILENFNSPYDSTVVKKLKEKNFVFLGKANMDEFAMGSSTENSAFKITKNPWDINRVPGGSSGGSAAAVSADLCAGSFGTDTGGSIRQPASLCGVVGLKPTYGTISRYGIIAFSSSLDQAGPIAKDVLDCAILLKAVSGYDKNDHTSRKFEVKDYPELVRRADKSIMKGLKIGFPVEFFSEGLDGDIHKKIMNVKELFKDLGAQTIDVSLPDTSYSVAAYYVIATSEASSNLERYDGVRYGYRFVDKNKTGDLNELFVNSRTKGFGKEVKRRIMLGTFALSAGYYDAYYKKASLVRKLIIKNYEDAFNKVDMIVGPTSPTAAFLIGEKMFDPLSMYLSDIYTISINLAYLPAMSIPIGITGENSPSLPGLPVGMQIIAPWLKEDKMLCVARIIEDMIGFRKKYKPAALF